MSGSHPGTSPRTLTGQDLAYIGVETHVARYEDTLLDLAIANDMGFMELAIANPGVDPWLPGKGTVILLPKTHLQPDAPHKGIVINLPAQRMFFYEKGQLFRSYPLGIGRDGHHTPTGATTIVRKRMNPAWSPTASARQDDPTLPAVFPPGPDNPLGERALYMGWPAYLIHGTNKEYGIGRRASRGCIRMSNADVKELFSHVSPGTPVTVVDQPIVLNAIGDNLYLEAWPSIRQTQQWEEKGRFDPEIPKNLHELVEAKAGASSQRVDWAVVDQAVRERRGIPVRITNEAAGTAVARSDVSTNAEEHPVDLIQWLRQRLSIGGP